MTEADHQSSLHIVPCSISDAKVFVMQHHRHLREAPPSGYFAVAVADDDGEVRGVAIVGRPSAAPLQDGWTVEVTRVATDGCPNACSCLYGAAWRAARALGWRRMVTYTRQTEPGVSLLAAGWRIVGEVKGRARGWDSDARPRVNRAPTQGKFRWEAPTP